ncbi:sigma factor [Vulcanococcus sp.]|uniref:sigma factor n=1 Tax=Vulcanococcus sp. TaxID=2856995 RepID=UPI003C04D6ED
MPDSAVDFWFNQMGRVPMLSKSETLRLARVVKEGKGSADDGSEVYSPKARRAINRLVAANLRLVVHLWNRDLSWRFPANCAKLPDLLQEGARGLVRAAELFDYARGYTFGTYAQAWIRKGFSDFMRMQNRTIHMPWTAISAVEDAREYMQECERTKTTVSRHQIELIARRHDVNPGLMPMYMTQYEITRGTSIDQLGDSYHDFVPAPSADTSEDEEAIRVFNLVADRAEMGTSERRILLAYEQGFRCRDIDNRWPEMAPSQPKLQKLRRRFKAAALATPDAVASLSAA